MKRILSLFLLGLMLCVLAPSPSQADVDGDSFYQISFIHPIQFIDEKRNIYGMRFNLGYGINYDVYGIDMGLINKTTHHQTGLQLGVYNTTMKMKGLQAGIINRTDILEGIQIGLLNFNTNGWRRFFPIVNWSF